MEKPEADRACGVLARHPKRIAQLGITKSYSRANQNVAVQRLVYRAGTKILSLTEPTFWNPVKNCASNSNIMPVPNPKVAWAAAVQWLPTLRVRIERSIALFTSRPVLNEPASKPSGTPTSMGMAMTSSSLTLLQLRLRSKFSKKVLHK